MRVHHSKRAFIGSVQNCTTRQMYATFCYSSPSEWRCISTTNATIEQPHRLTYPETIRKLRRDVVDKIAHELGVSQHSDWYRIRKRDVAKRGKHLFRHYQSVFELVQDVYPEYVWDPSLFQYQEIQEREWKDLEKQRAHFDNIARELGIVKMSDWYQLTRREVEAKGASIFKFYPSLPAALKAVYPEYPWEPANFAVHLSGFWKDENNLRKALDRAEQNLGISKPEDWYTVNLTDLREGGFPALVTRQQLVKQLVDRYPDYPWQKAWLMRGRFAQQKRLENAVNTLFEGEEVRINVRDAGLVHPDTGVQMELDVFVPSRNLAFEYQERYHYISAEYTYTPQNEIVARDQVKREVAAQKGITLIIVPCWWDGTITSLVATIAKVRPDAQLNKEGLGGGEVIPEQPPEGFFDSKKLAHLDDIGEPTTACFFTLSNVDPAGWWLFEKYDGLRGFWNPKKNSIYSRFNTQFELPPEVLATLPTDLFLDGELWFGRDAFQEATAISRRKALKSVDWTKFKYMVFDVPNHKGTYEERFRILEERFGVGKQKYIQLARKEECRDAAHLEHFFQDVIDRGGEGVILRNPTAPFRPGRCPGYMKHKKFRDAEAKVINKTDDGKWECILPNGIRFTAPAGTKEFVDRWNPQPGDVVSFKHHGFLLASKKPKWPTLYRLRSDLSWDDVVHNWKEKKIVPTALPVRKPKLKHRPLGFWGKAANRKRFLEELARKLNLDPEKANDWSQMTTSQVMENNGLGLLSRYGGSLREALLDTFVDMPFDFQVMHKPKRYWADLANRKEYLNRLAKDLGFDPSDASKWVHVSAARVLQRNGAGLLKRYGGSMKKALADTLPEIFAQLPQQQKQ